MPRSMEVGAGSCPPPSPPSSTRTGTPGSPTATSSRGRTAWSSCGTTGASGATCPATTTSPTPAKWGWVSCDPPCAPHWGGCSPPRSQSGGSSPSPQWENWSCVWNAWPRGVYRGGGVALVWGCPHMAGCHGPSPPSHSAVRASPHRQQRPRLRQTKAALRDRLHHAVPVPPRLRPAPLTHRPVPGGRDMGAAPADLPPR